MYNAVWMTGALERINGMKTMEFEKLALRVARELGFQVRGTRAEEDRVEMDSYLSLPTGEVLHYFVVFSRRNPDSDEIVGIIEKVNNPFVKILYMTTGEADEETRRLCSAKGIELAEWDRLMQVLDRYGILRELEREPEKEAFLPSIGEVEALEGWARDFLKEGNNEKAMEYVDRALSIKPELPELLKLKGDILYSSGRYREAEKQYRKALERQPDYFDAWLSLSKVLKEMGRDDEALIAMERATEIRADDQYLWLEKGLMLYEKGLYEEALLCFTRATEINPGAKEAWNDRGLALKKLGRFEEAIESFNRAIQMDGRFWDALLNKALLLHETGSLSEAVRIYDRMIEIREDPRIICQKGFALEEMGRTDEAAEMFQKAIEMDPSLGPCREELEKLKGVTKAPEEVEEKVEAEVIEEPQGPEEGGMAETQEEAEIGPEIPEKKEEEAPVGLAAIVSAIKEAEVTEEEDFETEHISNIKEEIERESQDIREIFADDAQEKEETSVEDADESVETGEVQEELEEEIEEMEKFIEDEESEIYRNLLVQEEELKSIGMETAEEEERTETEEEGIEGAEEREEIEKPPSKPDIMEGITSLSQLMARGNLYYKMGRYEEAAECYRALTEAKPNAKEIWNMYGSALFMLERYEEAAKAFSKALELDGTYRKSLLNLAESQRISGSPHESLEIINGMLREERGDSILWIKRGKILSTMEREGASVQSYSKVLEKNPGMIRVWNAMGISLVDIEEWEDARDAFEKGISVDERDYLLWSNYGALLFLMGDEDGAMEAMERAIGENLRYAPANNNIGVILARKGKTAGARERFGLALESDRNAIYAYNNTKYLKA